MLSFFFFFNDTATTEIYTLSLHDALPIYGREADGLRVIAVHMPRYPEDTDVEAVRDAVMTCGITEPCAVDNEIGRAHVELQSRQYLVCRLLLEKKKIIHSTTD